MRIPDKEREDEKCRIYCNRCLNEYPCSCKSLSEGIKISDADPREFKRIIKINKIFNIE